MTYRVLTVCTGNICRSPMAEVALQRAADRAGLDVEVESAAVTREEIGNPIDYRAQRTLRDAGYDVPKRGARQITRRDIEDYDLILPMTRGHLQQIERLAQAVPASRRAEIRLWREFASDADQRAGYDLDVPDPWYGGQGDFEETLYTIEDATPALLDHVRQNS